MIEPIDKESNIHDNVLKILGEVDRPGEVCTQGDRPLTMPGLQVEELGDVSLPLGKTQARKLIKLCQQAPYGKGTATLVDTNVRRVWELDPDQFKLRNPKWNILITEIVTELRHELGLQDCKLVAHLYKLLVYEKGSFFLPHRDGEKLNRMVATLVVCLPAIHQGGKLIVSHDGQQHEIVFAGAASGFELSYAAFYADCQHEVRPLRSGYRLCLVYNVTLARSRGKGGIIAPTYTAITTAMGELLADWRTDAESKMLAVSLDHRYTQDGVTFDKLKGIDRARAGVLMKAAEQAGCIAHLALITLWQHGTAEGGYDDYSYGRGRGRGYRWPEDDEDETASEYEMGDLIECSLSANHWSDRTGCKVQFGEISMDKDDIVSTGWLDDGDPSREDFEGYTGNAGMTLERWYHRAAIIIWPREKHFQVLCDAGTDAAISGLRTMVKQLRRSAKADREKLRQDCLSFAAVIIDSWQTISRCSWEETDNSDRSLFLPLLTKLDDPDLVGRFISQVMPLDTETQLDKSFGKYCKQHGWANFEPALARVLANLTVATVNRNAELLSVLCLQRDKHADRIALCTRLSEQMVKALEIFDTSPSETGWQVHHVDRAALLTALIKAMLVIDAGRSLTRLIDHVLVCAKKYNLTTAHVAAIFALESRITSLSEPNSAISQWLTECRRQLEERTLKAPQKPLDYRRPDKLSCECGDCRELSIFLANADERQHRFAVRKDRRGHLHDIIRQHRSDVTHVTERKGSPYTLVCNKTMASYKAALKIYQRDLQNLSRIIVLEKKL